MPNATYTADPPPCPFTWVVPLQQNGWSVVPASLVITETLNSGSMVADAVVSGERV
ncbi:MAG: hypothetical protein HYS20_10015 [Rhodocyclales bacterium]|nr:hypothetical protein [Rhodocyclales bacterium]